MNTSFIEVKNLTKRFNKNCFEALKNINLHINEGDIFGIIGLSGAGKSTLMRCLTTLEKPCEGTIHFKNEKLFCKNSFSKYRNQFGMVFQQFNLFGSRTVEDNIAYPLEISKMDKAKIRSRVAELLDLVGLSHKKGAYPNQLSGGEKQRVGIARALANHPKILFCDEATSALDKHTTFSILQLLLKLNKELGLTIVFITHQIEVIKEICNRVAVINHGQIIEEGYVKDVLINPKHKLTRQLVLRDIEHIPEGILDRFDSKKKVIRLSFEGQSAKEPIISQMIRQCQVDANILFGGLDYYQQMLMGHLFIEIDGSEEAINSALVFLQAQNIHHEVFKHESN